MISFVPVLPTLPDEIQHLDQLVFNLYRIVVAEVCTHKGLLSNIVRSMNDQDVVNSNDSSTPSLSCFSLSLSLSRFTHYCPVLNIVFALFLESSIVLCLTLKSLFLQPSGCNETNSFCLFFLDSNYQSRADQSQSIQYRSVLGVPCIGQTTISSIILHAKTSTFFFVSLSLFLLLGRK